VTGSTSPTVRRFTTPSGLTVVGDDYGPGSRPPVLLLHGGGQTRHAWGGTAEVLADHGFHVVSLDARGHGDSDWSPEGDYSHQAMIDDLECVADLVADEAGGVRPALVGASMGGIISLLGLARRPDIGRALVLVDVATRMEEEGVGKIQAFMRGAPSGFASVEEAADAVAAYQPHRPRPKDVSGLRKNLRLREDGRWYWHWDPEFINPEGKSPRASRNPEMLDAAAASLTVPVLLVRGRMSDVLSEEGAQFFLAQVPHARYVDVAGAAHMVAGDRNDAFTSAVVEFLDPSEPSGSDA
jgi:pimeloyl-ACP methyl ester carboxylesterase